MLRTLNAAFVAVLLAVAAVGLLAAPAGAATTPRSALVGELGYEGGAYPGRFHPTAGTVEVVFENVPLVLVKSVGPSGMFAIPLGPGTYSVVGCGPSSSGVSHQCSRAKTIVLRPGEVDHIRLIWAYVP
jgi:hypothetical protein